MYASINGKTLVTIKDEQGLFHAVEVESPGFENETDALRLGINRVLAEADSSNERIQAERLLDADDYLTGKTNQQKRAILQAAKVLGRTVFLHAEGRESQGYEVRIAGTGSVGLKAVDTGKTAILHYEEITGGWVNDPE